MKIGDRIEMVEMDHDPNPIQRGTKGTIVSINDVQIKPAFTQIGVDWDNGRRLSVVIPPDVIKVVKSI